MTAPLTPVDCDLRDFPSMLLDVARLRDSTLASSESGDAFRAAVLLWAASWHQVPASSLPDDDAWIATQAGYALRGKIDRAWGKVREGALRKYIKCDDGRLYHPVVAEKALECWLSKLAARLSSGAGNAKRHKIEFDPAPIEAQMATARALLSALNPHSRALTRKKHSAAPAGPRDDSQEPPGGTPAGNPPGSQEKDKGREGSSSEANASAGADAPPPVDKSTGTAEQPTAATKRTVWNACGSWMVRNGLSEEVARTFMGLIVKDHPLVALAAMTEAPTAQADCVDPKGYLKATALRMDGARKDPVTVPDNPLSAMTQAQLAEQDARSAALAARTDDERAAVSARLAEARERAAANAAANTPTKALA